MLLAVVPDAIERSYKIIRNEQRTVLKLRQTKMAWKTPKIVEVSVGMEINMYMCAARK